MITIGVFSTFTISFKSRYEYRIQGTDFKLVFAVLPIRIRRIRMFLSLPDPHPDPLVTSTDPDPFIIKQK
jgi:hypothetical protein